VLGKGARCVRAGKLELGAMHHGQKRESGSGGGDGMELIIQGERQRGGEYPEQS